MTDVVFKLGLYDIMIFSLINMIFIIQMRTPNMVRMREVVVALHLIPSFLKFNG
jgi:hypothetical protein